ncbi:interleukin-6 receptor subunit alpha isoform X2 [Danio aesculapii]|uniref:interleukin-6 receptor subunit alpha isoform X2 n=1 Tax=Danio aesculapii TaxID=1142201 RepID=UPI0024BFF0AE|nr:interleukin-6 receptor subunit alpha isoform X2 [Danio aesculapii]
MWTRSTRMFLLAVFAAVKVQSAREEAELCPRQDAPSGVLVLNLGSNVVLGCRGDVTVDNVPLASARVMNKKYTNKQKEDITASWTSQRHEHPSTQLTSMKGDAPTATYQNIDSAIYSKTKVGTTVTDKPSITTRKEQSTSRRVLRAVSQTPGEEKETFGITQWSDFDEDDYEDYDYEEERSRVTRGIKKQTRWTLNGRQVRAGVERGGILRRPHLSWADAGNYSCYRGERLISTFRISVGAPPKSPAVFCNIKSHTSKVRCDWTSKQPVIPRPVCYLLLNRRFLENTLRVNCSFSRSRCWCAFFVKEDHLRALHRAQLCVSNIAGSAMSPILNFYPQDTIRPDPPSRVLVSAVEGLKHMLKVSWSYPSSWKSTFYILQFHLRYRPQLAERYQFGKICDKMERHLSWMIYDALPDTVYEVQLKAKDEFDGIWSDWTEPVFAVTWSAPETTTATESITFEPNEGIYEGSGGSGEEPGVVSVVVAGDADTEFATVWLNRTHLITRIGKQALPFTSLLHSSQPLPAPAASEQLPEEGKSLMSTPKHNQQQVLPLQPEEQEAIHLHNIDYFLSPGAEGVPLTINRNE